MTTYLGKELFIRVTMLVYVLLSLLEDGMWDLIVLIPDYCLSCYVVFRFFKTSRNYR